ncbi:unnamed protein product [Lactuca virosa]|uniref:Nucleoside-diphosphate kinase n=1 Tax=Lactuca virosa TaxID=75947 RepID=A0AAU9MCM7_9ASTR|nr:unnamed protein product [Lactuca virosa]
MCWRSIRGNAFEPWFLKWENTIILSEATLLCSLSSNLIVIEELKRGYKFVILKPVIMTKFDIMEVIRKEFMIAGLKGIKLCYSHASHSDRIRYRGSYSKRIYDCGHEGGGILLQLSIPGLR